MNLQRSTTDLEREGIAVLAIVDRENGFSYAEKTINVLSETVRDQSLGEKLIRSGFWVHGGSLWSLIRI